jgi:hypothetical protein
MSKARQQRAREGTSTKQYSSLYDRLFPLSVPALKDAREAPHTSSLYDRLFPLPVPALKKSRATARLYRLKLKTDRQHQALKSLKLPSCNRGLQRKFEQHILAHLAFIRDVPSPMAPHKEKPRMPMIATPLGPPSCPAVIVREFRRASLAAAGMVRRLKKQSAIFQDFGCFLLPEPPIEELQLYAEKLSAQANASTIKIHRLRHPADAKTRDIAELITFVQGMTSKRHWDNLAILLQEALGDLGINGDRLRKRYQYHQKHGKLGLRALARITGRPTSERPRVGQVKM